MESGHGGDGPAVETAMIARDTGCYMFIRAAPGLSEVVCSIFAPGADVSDVEDASRALGCDMLGLGPGLDGALVS